MMEGSVKGMSPEGGAFTMRFEDGAGVFLTGDSLINKIMDDKGKSLDYDPADIVMHELVGHAIPYLVGRDTGNGIKNENKVRTDLGLPLRQVEENHPEESYVFPGGFEPWKGR
jgi:hypothetical protein